MKGMNKFREHFAGYEDQYALIGGAACDLLFGEAGLPFRATRDLDIVLCVEVVSANFAKTFAAFLDAGGYQAREKSSGGKEFFRFHKPSADNFPHMLELFARAPETLGEIEAMGVLTWSGESGPKIVLVFRRIEAPGSGGPPPAAAPSQTRQPKSVLRTSRMKLRKTSSKPGRSAT